VHPANAGGELSSVLVPMTGIGTGLARRFNGDYRLSLHETAEGLQLTSGLVQITTETLPVGRVQALWIVEPLLWCPFGWCRVEAGDAGKASR